MNNELTEQIIALIKREVVPAIGCTEPAAVSLCVAKATELLGTIPEKISLRLSGNIIKNAMGVGIPGTGMIGLPIAVALGAIVGKSEYGLEVLRDITTESLEAGKQYIAENRISIERHKNPPSILHIDVDAEAGGRKATAVISQAHTNFTHLELDGEVILHKENEAAGAASDDVKLSEALVYEFATTTPLDKIEFILEAAEMNKHAAEVAFKGDWGHCLGATIRRNGLKIFGDTPFDRILSLTSAACDARMGGAKVAVMSNSGSGNQGITTTLPVVGYAEEAGSTREELIRALIMSHLTSIYIKQSLGRLSALCGCVVASTGASAGIVLLMGGGYGQVCAAIKNMVANLTGMICDGAKPSCAMKVTSGVSTALMSAMLAMNGRCVTQLEGIVCDDIDRTIRNLTSIGRDTMTATDHMVLDIMVNK